MCQLVPITLTESMFCFVQACPMSISAIPHNMLPHICVSESMFRNICVDFALDHAGTEGVCQLVHIIFIGMIPHNTLPHICEYKRVQSTCSAMFADQARSVSAATHHTDGSPATVT